MPLFEKSPIPMWMYDRDSLRFVAVNEAATRDYGYTRDELLAMTIADIRPPEDLTALHADVATATGLTGHQTWRHRRKDGTIVTVEVRANDFVQDGRAVRLVAIFDVTERERAQVALRRTEDQLRHAQKMDAIGQLAGGVAHDFNNILTVIGSYARLLHDALPAGDRRSEDANEIRRASERGTRITRQLLAVSRHSMAAPRSLDLPAVVAELAPMLRRLIGREVRLVVTPTPELPPVFADPSQLEQVLMNLAVNARDAMPAGGRLTIEVRRQDLDADAASARRVAPGAYVVLAVTDTGGGMTADTQRRIFDPFFTTKEAGKGTGLGLSIVHGIVSQAGGAIAVYSEVGHGTTFRVLLPAMTAATVVVEAAHAEREVPVTLPAVTALVVDDEHHVRAVAVRILADAGCRVLEASSAEEARRICVSHEGPIEVAVLDVVLADGRGDLLVGQLRALRPRLAFVLVSGYPAGALSARGGLPRDLLPKPFTPPELRAAVSRALGERADAGVVTGPTATNRKRVLVVDDDGDLRRLTSRLLRRAGFEVIEADDGKAAIAAFAPAAPGEAAASFDVVVSDVHMPHITGIELLRAVRRVDLDVPVLLMSASPDVASATQAVELGAFRYLAKPFDADAMVKAVQHAARAHALARLRREAFALTGARTGAADRAGLEVRFEQALEGLWLATQPIVDGKTGALFAVEALMRSKEASMPTPGAILDAATLLARLPQLGRRVRGLAAAGMAADPSATWFVNLHPSDLEDLELVAADSALASVSRRVVLEITERAALDHTPQLTARLARLRELGFRIAVDDLGAGYSSLASFTELAPEIVKIDMSLVREINLSAIKQRVVAALCTLAHDVGTVVVAEGIETDEERECCVAVGCDLLQGYLLGRPTP